MTTLNEGRKFSIDEIEKIMKEVGVPEMLAFEVWRRLFIIEQKELAFLGRVAGSMVE